MTVKVYTESKSLYTFQMEGEQLTFSLQDLDLLTGEVRKEEGGELKGIVTRVNQPISEGGIVDLRIREYDLWGKLKERENSLKSVRITQIEICE